MRPEEVTTDKTFIRAGADTTYRRQEVVEADYPWYVRIFVPSAGTFASWLVALPFSAALIGVPATALRLILGPRRRSRPR
ncbi:hypothetical protein ASJ30_00435 [Janibacter indicus]|uniref:Uncharacterized protein n=1 Tax=Janibacter indicus TaxID=857417 RepID=A0A1L3MCT2_9MICO|nr:hypothetical protein [Janibacter indicus]APH00184.1 hypothetical protein ASJ30_00435 [Janibacter indicus]